MHRIRRAVIMAAGFGSRLRPLTDTTPKPLLRVGGQPMIENLIEALHANRIREIYIVVGYLKEQFLPLAQADPDITLIENPDYATANNISSLYYAREHLEEAVILDGDQLISDASILNPFFQRSCYCAIQRDGHTDEWLLTVEHDRITHCSRDGGEADSSGPACWELHSVSFWTKEDGARLRAQLEAEYPANNQIYWDDIPMFCYPQDYELGIRPIEADALVEIDSLADLEALNGH